MKVLLLGATGLIGHACLERLLATSVIDEIIAPSRRTLSIQDRRLTNLLLDFDRLDEYPEIFEVDAILCCLGTTLKQAGGRSAFRKVDFQYCRDAAELGRAQQARAFLLVSAVGAAKHSPVFYSRVKGELEAYLTALEYPLLSIYRPSLLLGEREGASRWAENVMGRLMPAVNPLLQGPLERYRAIDADLVAAAMVNETSHMGASAEAGERKVNVYTHADIVKLAAS